ncbi:MAG: NAD(P)-binding domain-containing protein [Gammaproteobacteria bacterium]
MTTYTRIAFIGGGNMARSLIGGLPQKGFAAAHTRVADPIPAQDQHQCKEFGVHAGTDNLDAIRDAQAVVFAVKPQVFRDAVHPWEALHRDRGAELSREFGKDEP